MNCGLFVKMKLREIRKNKSEDIILVKNQGSTKRETETKSVSALNSSFGHISSHYSHTPLLQPGVHCGALSHLLRPIFPYEARKFL